MDTLPKNYKSLEKLLALMDTNAMSHSEFVKAFEVVMQMVRDLKVSNEKEFTLMRDALDTLSQKLKADNGADAQEMRSLCESMMADWAAKIEMKVLEMDAKMDAVQDGEPGEPGKDARPEDVAPFVVPLVLAALPPDVEETGDEIIAKINAASDLIEPGSVRGLAELERTVGENSVKSGGRSGWGAHPLTIQGLGTLVDKNTRVINFTGEVSVTRSPSGVVTVAIGSGAGTDVSGEDVSSQAPGTTFTLAHTPVTGSVKVFRGGNRQNPGALNDYTISGKIITFNTTVSLGEIILIDYVY